MRNLNPRGDVLLVSQVECRLCVCLSVDWRLWTLARTPAIKASSHLIRGSV